VTYWTDIDLHQHPERLLAHRALMSLGHDEYWSTRMRRGAEAARDHGVNLAFLGANAIFRHIRLQPSPTGPDREEVNYKPWSARDDPAWRTDPAEVTTDWREPPLNDPESRLLGDLYECNPVRAAGVVVDPAAWLFAGTGMRAGMLLPGLVDSLGNPDPNVIVVGQGACWVFRDGRVLTGTWRRPAVGQVMRLTGRGGQTITLHPGRTWIELEPVGYTPRLS
jgi:hypothetical protein